jgi:protein O-mannosyl-transferase
MSRSPKKARPPQDRNRRGNTASNKPTSATAPQFAGFSGLSSAMRSDRVKNCLFAATLVAAVFLVYQPAWNGGFLWDDDTHLLNNPVLRPGGLLRTWVPGTYANYWPLTATVYRLEFDMWGLDPLGFHLVNIALHALSALLVWRILTLLRIPGAMLAAAIFALHPVNVESVAWIAQLKNVLSLPLALLAMLFYLRHERNGYWWQLTASLTLFLLSALAKGMTLTLPVVLLACAWWQRGRIGRRDLLRILPFLLVGGLMVGMEVFQQHFAGAAAVRSDSLLGRAVVAGCAVWFYFWKLIWPVNLTFVYPRWTIGERDLMAYLPGALLVATLALAWWQRRSWGRPVVMLLVCYVALLLPALGFVNIFFMEYSLVADHWQYAAMIVPCAALAAALATLGDWLRWPWRGEYAFSLALLAILAVLTFRQSHAYADIETLYRTTVARNPACWLIQNNLGNLLTDKGKLSASQGRIDEATTWYRESLSHYRDALKAKPDYADAHLNFGSALARLGRTDEAIGEFRQAVISYQGDLKVQRGCIEAHCNLGRALVQQGRFEDAIAHYQDALKIDADDFPTLNELAWLRATCSDAAFRNPAEAVDLAQRAYTLSKGRDPTVIDTLAAAYAEAGRFPEAVQAARRALGLASRQNNAALAERITARLRLYEARTPYRQSSTPGTLPGSEKEL